MAFEGYANIIADSLMQGGAGLGRGIGEGLSGLGSGIAGGMMKRADNKREDAQLAEKRRQEMEDFGLDLSTKLSLIDQDQRFKAGESALDRKHDYGLTADKHRRDRQLYEGMYGALAKNDPETRKLMARIAALELQLNQVPKQPGATAQAPATVLPDGSIISGSGGYMGQPVSNYSIDPTIADIQRGLEGY